MSVDMKELKSTNREVEETGYLSGLGWLFTGLVLPCVSPTFYRNAVRRRLISAILFFLLFTSTITGLTALGVSHTLFSMRNEISRAFESGEFPVINIRDGIANASGLQPYIIFNENSTFAAVDTSGKITQIDRHRYYQGLLLTQRSLHVLNNGEYQKLPLKDLQEALDINPIVIDSLSVSRFWTGLSGILAVFSLLMLAVWHILLRFIHLLLLGMLVWGIASLVKSGTRFETILIAGIYAIIPAIYGEHLLAGFGISFFGIYSLILLTAWGIALVAALGKRGGGLLRGERPLRGWRAWIGAPMLIAFALDSIYAWPNGKLIVCSIAIVTFAALLIVGILTGETYDHEEPFKPVIDIDA